MSNGRTQQRYGPALIRFLRDVWEAEGTTQTAWARKAGIEGANLTRWADGATPGVDLIRQVAEALGRPVLDLYVAAEILTPEEAGGHVVTPPTPPEPPTVAEAIDRDPSLSEYERAVLRVTWEFVQRVRRGETSPDLDTVIIEATPAPGSSTKAKSARRRNPRQ